MQTREAFIDDLLYSTRWDAQLDYITTFLSVLLQRGKWDHVNSILGVASKDIYDLDLDEVFAYLMPCTGAKERFTKYEQLLKAAKKRFKKEDEESGFQLFVGL